jgi:hypothetical protein
MTTDRALRELYPAAFKVWAFLEPHLDRHDWRPMKLEVVMLSCRMKKRSAGRALHTLIHRGYIARRGGGPKPYEYRLLPPPMPSVKANAA